MEEKENGEGKGEKMFFFVWRRRKTKRENIGRGIIFCAEEKEEIICRRKTFFCLDKKTTAKEKEQNI